MKQVTLYTYGISQSSEKVRWALEYTGVPYVEKRLAPFVHRPLNATNTGELLSPMPVLVADGETIADSTRILEWLSVHRAPFPVIPRDPAVRASVMNIESRFDHAAIHLLRWTYARLLREPPLARRLWSIDANPLQALALHAGFHMIKYVFERGIGFDSSQLDRSRRMIDRVVDELNAAADAGKTLSRRAEPQRRRHHSCCAARPAGMSRRASLVLKGRLPRCYEGCIPAVETTAWIGLGACNVPEIPPDSPRRIRSNRTANEGS